MKRDKNTEETLYISKKLKRNGRYARIRTTRITQKPQKLGEKKTSVRRKRSRK